MSHAVRLLGGRVAYAGAGAALTAEEREIVKLLTTALSTAWELRRLELAQRPPIDHELIIVAEFSVGAVLVPAYEPLAQRAPGFRGDRTV